MKAATTLTKMGLKVGDVVTCYYKGYHKIVGISASGYEVQVKALLSQKLTKTSGVVRECDPAYCKLVDKESLLKQLTESVRLVEEMFS
jgi:hypothetical protein